MSWFAAFPVPFQVVGGPTAVAVALLTQLGDLWFLFTLVALVYWLDAAAPWVGHGLDRERAALVVALLVGAVAMLVTFKPLFGIARPPGFDVPPTVEGLPATVRPVYVWMATADGYSFPSGHALAATLVWGGLAWGVQAGRLSTRAVVAATVVVLVSATRVLLGVHYPVDVAVGMAIALGYLVAVVRWLRDPGPAFALGTIIGAVGVAITGVTTDGAAAMGLAAGLTATWYWLGEELVAAPATRPGSLATTAIGLLTAGPLLVASVTLHPPAWLAAVTGALGGCLLLALPLVGERVGLVVLGHRARPTERF